MVKVVLTGVLFLILVSREDSSQSLASCLALLHSPIEPSSDKVLGREPRGTESSHRYVPSQNTALRNLAPYTWSSVLVLSLPRRCTFF
uniref:Secreted protein n=1 Tax=Anguilla anguilla TaxID=7936 RepID=A0A0E9P8W7_ANGAN